MDPQRKKVSVSASLLLSVAFGGLLLAANTSDLFIGGLVQANQPLQFTLRIPNVGIYKDTIHSGQTFQHVQRVFPRGQVLDKNELQLVKAHEEVRRPPRATLLLGLGLTFVTILFLFSRFAAVDSPKSAQLRTQILLFGVLAVAVIGAEALLLLTPWSATWIPVSLVVIPIARHLGHRVAAAAAVAMAVVLGFHSSFDLVLAMVLLGQGLAAAIVAAGTGRLRFVGAAVGAAAGGGLASVTTSLLLTSRLPPLQTCLLPPMAAGLMGGVLAVVVTGSIGRLLGVVSKSRLLAMANLDAPLLKQLASRAPGTWAHSMAMANMAEMAANAIGADGLLVRVGAYYHDLGKSAQPKYFIENQEGDNPHDELAPDVSADAIFGHVTEGVKQARKHKLPQQIVDFITTHHGQGLLEYFWHKNQETGNPKQLDEADFHYPGDSPRSRETAILSLCDAVEAASRTLEEPTHDAIRKMVRQITLNKMEQGLLDEAGLNLGELQKVMNSLVETLKSTRHSRIRYPWQEEDDEKKGPQPGPGGPPSNDEEGRARVRTRPLGVPEDPPDN